MEIEAEGIDDILIKMYPKLLEIKSYNEGTRGNIYEIIGVLIKISNPRARISRSENRGKPFSALGELLWYLSGSDRIEFIGEYIDAYHNDAEADGRLHGAYGPRINNMRDKVNQLESIISLLEKRPTSKRAVIQIFNAEDLTGDYKEIPCTTTMQFFIRDEKLHLSTTMRSNDAYLGLPHDVFCFTMIQELIARRLGYELGCYYHYAGSMHVYEKHKAAMQNYINEGWQRPEIMPRMPDGDPFNKVEALLAAEKRVRNKENVCATSEMADDYWADILRLLQAFWASGNESILDEISNNFKYNTFRAYLNTRRNKSPK
ncbi:thymidylate synthase [Ochrobactrum quorumnocens]|uniref:thymidylate synthase n=1 Tax=Ochrobactrum quorumnocens TaxID=271865 RepID=A0A5N1K5V3_9HYPH|nr:thymidylate synthase [[Ochrobactrum] quorumnocens]KAA9369584.1 thymidylate synthase [[Ochrobactrum] quorumnocens]